MNIIGLLKYVLPEHNSDFEYGKLYMNDLVSYKDENISDDLIKDMDEGIIYEDKNPDNTLFYFQIEGEKDIHQLAGLNALRHSKWLDGIEHVKINCFTIISTEDIEKDQNGYYKLKESFISSLPNYSDERIIHVTLKPGNFIECIKGALKDNEFTYLMSKPVIYFEEKHPLFDNIRKIENDLERVMITAFYKNISYKHQREYRIAIHGYTKKYINYNNYDEYWHSIEDITKMKIKPYDLKS